MHRRGTNLLLVDNVDASLDVWEGMRRGKDSFAFVLLVQLAMCTAVQGEGSTIHEGTQIVVLVEVGDAFFQFISVKVRLDIGDLKVGLTQERNRNRYHCT